MITSFVPIHYYVMVHCPKASPNILIMNKNNLLSCIEVNPSTNTEKSIIWLHGLGADGNDFTPIIPQLNLTKSNGVRFIFPNAPIRPVSINNGFQMRAWYDITSLDTERTNDIAGIQQSVSAIEALIEREISNNLKPADILLAGFSQGAAIALSTLLHTRHQLGGIIALSGYLPLADDNLLQNAAHKDTPIYMAHGTFDTVVPYALGKRSFEQLEANGFNIKWHHYPMSHEVCMDEIRDIGAFINETL